MYYSLLRTVLKMTSDPFSGLRPHKCSPHISCIRRPHREVDSSHVHVFPSPEWLQIFGAGREDMVKDVGTSPGQLVAAKDMSEDLAHRVHV